MTGFIVVVCAVLGLCVGSFLNVVIWRVPRHESVVRPPSHCPACETEIRPRDNVPVASWLLLRGRCRSCGTAISVRYPLVEAGTGLLWALLGLRFADSWALPAYLVLGAGLVALALIDLDTFLLPNRIVYPLTVVVVVLLAAAAAIEQDWTPLVRALAGGAAAFGVFLALHLVSPRGMGFGDVKLAFVLGVALGWVSGPTVFLGFFLAFLLGAAIGILLIATGVRGRRDHVPFGPFLALGTLLALLVGDPLLALVGR